MLIIRMVLLVALLAAIAASVAIVRPYRRYFRSRREAALALLGIAVFAFTVMAAGTETIAHHAAGESPIPGMIFAVMVVASLIGLYSLIWPPNLPVEERPAAERNFFLCLGAIVALFVALLASI